MIAVAPGRPLRTLSYENIVLNVAKEITPKMGESDRRIAALLEDAGALARERGGRLLADRIPNSHTNVLWECTHGHRWEARLNKVKRGSWCAACAGKGPVTIEDMRRLAVERGGKCLSAEYVNNVTPLEWRCGEHHLWWARPGDIHRTWCPVCARNRKLELSELRKIACSRGGRLLSTHYSNCEAPLLWHCALGHIWSACAKSVKGGGYHRGTWCPKCARKRGSKDLLTLDSMKQLAGQRGGECLSDRYVNCMIKLTWRCALGHEWMAKPAFVKQGTWCPVCSHRQKLTVDQLRDFAAERGGKLISTEYLDTATPVLWECSEGHQWQATPGKVRYGTWCPHCAGKHRLTIEEMRELARANGGECLSKRYVNSGTPLLWRCAQGHVWKAAPNMVKPSGYQMRGTWCRICADAPKYTIEDMREMARARDGECLSGTYVNNETPLKWRCANGHIWEAPPAGVRPYSEKSPGSWCPVCARDKFRLTIEDMRAVARDRGGECLSNDYINSRTKLRWRCADGHVWLAKPNKVKPWGPLQRSSWCPFCARQRPARAASPV